MMTTIITDIILYTFTIYVLYDFFKDILEKRLENKAVIILVLACSALASYGINSFQSIEVNLLGISTICLCTTFILYTGNRKSIFLYFLIFYTILLSVESVTEIFFVFISGADVLTKPGETDNRFFVIIIAKLLTYTILRFIKSFLNKAEAHAYGNLIGMAYILPITTVFIYSGVFFSKIPKGKGYFSLTVGGILLLLCNVLVFYILEKLTFVMNQNKEYELIEMQNNLHNIYCDKMEEISLQHRKYAHNLKDYLQTIGGLAVQSQNQEILGILKDMEVEIDSISDKVYTKNSILNALLCEREAFANKNKVTMEIMIEPGLNLDYIKRGDLIVMLGNLLDNAIEAAAQCEEQKTVDLKFFKSQGNFIVINIENTYTNEIRKSGMNYLSTKKNGKKHGLGLKSVVETAQKYGGMLYSEQKDGKFTSILTLSKSYHY